MCIPIIADGSLEGSYPIGGHSQQRRSEYTEDAASLVTIITGKIPGCDCVIAVREFALRRRNRIIAQFASDNSEDDDSE